MRVRILAVSVASLAVLLAPLGAVADSGDFGKLVAAAQAAAVADRPAVALAMYRDALGAAQHDPVKERVARFGQGRMLMWLGRYEEARATYERLLCGELSEQDRQLALAGEVESLAALDRPHSAYRLGERTPVTSPDLAFAMAQAAWWSGRPQRAREILDGSRDQADALPRASALSRRLQALDRDVRSQGSPEVSSSASSAKDSDGLTLSEAVLAMREPVGTASFRLAARAMRLDGGGWSTGGRGVRAGLSAQPRDGVTATLDVGESDYAAWRTAVWNGEVGFEPSDTLRLSLSSTRDPVETRAAIDARTSATTSAVSAQLRPAGPASATIGAFRTAFSDGNVRVGSSATVRLNVLPAAGIALEARGRVFFDRLVDTGTYFSPGKYAQEEGVLAFRHAVRGWLISSELGLGRQQSAGTAGSSTSLVRIGVRTPRRGCLRGGASYAATDSALASPSGYRRSLVSVDLSCGL